MDQEPTVPLETLLTHREWVDRVARSLMPGAAANDLAQRVWLQAIERPPRHDRGIAAWFLTLLRRGVRDMWREESRRRAREGQVAIPEEGRDTAAVIASADTHRRVVNAVMALPEPLRAAVLLRFYEDMGPSEIARRENIPVETVRSRLKRATALLRARLTREYGGEGNLAVAFGLLLRIGKGGAAVTAKTKALATTAALLFLGGIVLVLSRPAPEPTQGPAPLSVARAAPPVTERMPAHEPRPTGEAQKKVEPPPPPEPRPTRPCFKVEVVDSIGAPVAGAQVVLESRAGTDLNAAWRRSTRELQVPKAAASRTTGPTGQVAFRGFDSGFYVFHVRAAGRMAVTRTFGIWRVPAPRPIRIVLPEGAELPGTARRPDGRPIGGLRVTAGEAHTTTDRTGAYVLSGLPPEPIEVQVRPSPDVVVDVGRVDPTSTKRFDFVVDGSARAGGRVTEKVGGAAIPKALVVLHGTTGRSTRFTARATTAADGSFEIRGLPAFSIRQLEVFEPSHLPFEESFRADSERPAATRDFERDVELSRGAVVRGRVTIGESQPAAGVTVRLYGTDWPTVQSDQLRTRTDEDGRYEIRAVPPGPATVSIAAKGCYLTGRTTFRGQAGLVVPRAGEVTWDLVLARGGIVEGRVLDPDGKPVPGITVVVGWHGSSSTGVSDERGRFRLEGVHPGTGLVVWIRPAPDWILLGMTPKSTPFNLDTGKSATGIVVTLPPGAVLAGRVVGPEGKPVPGAILGVGPPGMAVTAGNAFAGIPVAPDGTFRIDRVYGKAVVLAATAKGYAETSVSLIAIAPGQVRDDIEVRLAAGRRISGRVVNGKGEGIAGVAVRAISVAAQGRSTAPAPVRATTGKDGKFAIFGLGEGRYVLTAETPESATASVCVGSASRNVTLVLTPGQTIAGVVLDQKTGQGIEGVPVVGTPIEPDPLTPHPTVRTRTDGQGRFELTRLTQQAYELRVASPPDVEPGDPPYAAAGARPVAAGTTGLRIPLVAGADIRGRVVDEAGDPVSHVGIGIRGRVPLGKRDPARLFREQTDLTGSFRIARLPPGVYDLWFYPQNSDSPEGEGLMASRLNGVRPGGSPLRIVLRRGFTISGKVLAPDGGALPKEGSLAVRCHGPKTTGTSDPGQPIRVRASGEFETDPLDPSETFDIEAEFPGFATAVLEGVRAGATNVVIRLDRGLSIEGQVVDEEGQPVAGVHVGVYPVGAASRLPPATTTDRNGRFRFTGLNDIEYEIFVGGPGEDYEGESGVRIRAGTSTVLRAHRLLLLKGRLVDAKGRPVVAGIFGTNELAAGGSCSVFAKTDLEGRFVLRGLKKGKFRLKASIKGLTFDLGEVPVPSKEVTLVLR